MTKDELIAALTASPLPGDAVVRFSCEAMNEGDLDELVGFVTGVGVVDDVIEIQGGGVDPEERKEFDKLYGHDACEGANCECVDPADKEECG